MEALGYIGAALLALCSLPLLVKTARDGHARGVSLGFLVMWWLGEMAMLGYVADKPGPIDAPLVFNYLANALIVGTILAYRVGVRP